jgi:hypothetical protein
VERHSVDGPFIANHFDLEVMFRDSLTEAKLVAVINSSEIANAKAS